LDGTKSAFAIKWLVTSQPLGSAEGLLLVGPDGVRVRPELS